MAKQNKPAIRFKEFTDAWEQRKLGEISKTTIGEFVIKTKQNDGFPYPVYNGGTSNTGFYDEFNNEGERILISARGANAGYVNFYKGRYWAGNSCYSVSINDSENYEIDFIYQEMKRNQHLFTDYQQAANIPSVSKADVEKFVLFIPTYDEQKLIGRYFQQLDNLITLHQRKYDKLQVLKKAMLEKMFPKNGSSVPEIRFKGFTDAWEQRKLGDDLVSIHTGTNLLGSTENAGMPLLKMGNIQRGYFDTSKIEFLPENEQPEIEDIANYGDFFFNTRNTLELVGKGATWMETSGKYAFNSNIARFELKDIDTIFFNYLYNTEDMTRQIHARAMGTTSVAAIYPRTLESVEYFVPCMQEQNKIGAYFFTLDHLITLHQRELEKLQNIKKSMLEKMFV